MVLAAPGMSWPSKHILVIDADDHFRFWTRGLFKQQKAAEVASLPNATEAKAMLFAHRVDVALVELPDNPAPVIELLRWLRRSSASPAPLLPVVLLCAKLDKLRLAQLLPFGVQSVLQKPLSGELLLKATAAALRNPGKYLPAPDPPLSPPLPGRSQATAAAAIVTPATRTAGTRMAAAAIPPAGRGSTAGPAAPPSKQVAIALETAPPPPPKDKQFVEAAPPPPPPREKQFVEAALPPPPPPSPPDLAGPDLESILAAHAQWVESGGSQGRRANLHKQDLSSRNLANALLTNAGLRHCDLSNSDLSNALLHGADLRNAELIGCTLTGCDLSVTRLRHARLRGSCLDGAKLTGADLAGADLTGTRFADADLSGANLLGVNLTGADLSGARGLSRAALEDAHGDSQTRLPLGIVLNTGEA